MEIYQYRHLASGDANSTVTVQTNDCTFGYITVNTTSAQALTVKDGLGNTIAVLKASIAEGTYTYRVNAQKGLTVAVPASYTGSATVAFK